MSHTPGPWKHIGFDEDDSGTFGWFVELPYHDGATIGRFGDEVRRIRCEGWGGDEATANALLVSAAPDLLEALEALIALDWEDAVYGWGYAFNAAEAAVAKARGES